MNNLTTCKRVNSLIAKTHFIGMASNVSEHIIVTLESQRPTLKGLYTSNSVLSYLLQFQGCRAPLQAWTAHFAKSHVTMLFTSASSQVKGSSDLAIGFVFHFLILICNYQDLWTRFACLAGAGYDIRLLTTHEGSSVTLRK